MRAAAEFLMIGTSCKTSYTACTYSNDDYDTAMRVKKQAYNLENCGPVSPKEPEAKEKRIGYFLGGFTYLFLNYQRNVLIQFPLCQKNMSYNSLKLM